MKKVVYEKELKKQRKEVLDLLDKKPSAFWRWFLIGILKIIERKIKNQK